MLFSCRSHGKDCPILRGMVCRLPALGSASFLAIRRKCTVGARCLQWNWECFIAMFYRNVAIGAPLECVHLKLEGYQCPSQEFSAASSETIR